MENNDITNNNQENQSSQWGGRRVGAGRPKGTGHKPKIVDDLTDEEQTDLLKKAYDLAKAGDSRLLQFFMEQLYGKARQNIGLDGGEEDKALRIIFDQAFKDRHE